MDRLIEDIQANALPAVTWVTPQFELSDHPPASSSFAHNWMTDVVNAVMKSDMWDQTAIFITWDEWGGFYDSVMPPAVDEVGLGFRVPLLTISPYTRRGLIDDEMGEFSTPAAIHLRQLGARPPHAADRQDAQHGACLRLRRRPRPPGAAAGAKTYEDPFDNPRWLSGLAGRNGPGRRAFYPWTARGSPARRPRRSRRR